MRAPLRVVLAQGEVIICDGATGTMLHAAGLPAGMMPEVWNIENPAAVQAVHRAYAEAGARLMTTNTLGGTGARLRDAGWQDRVIEMNRAAAMLARESLNDEVWLAGSMGPTGKLMEPYGPLSVAETMSLFTEQVHGLVEGGVDALLIETHHALEEAQCAVRAARSLGDLPILCTFAFDAKGRTLMGLRPEVAAREMEALGVDVVGANCGAGPQAVQIALEKMRGATHLPLMAKANAGIPQLGSERHTVWDVTPEQMSEHARAFAALGAQLIGGCCGTTPRYIEAMATALRTPA